MGVCPDSHGRRHKANKNWWIYCDGPGLPWTIAKAQFRPLEQTVEPEVAELWDGLTLFQ